LVSIKELYYDARPTKSQDIKALSNEIELFCSSGLYPGPNSEHPGIFFSSVLLLGRTLAVAVTVVC